MGLGFWSLLDSAGQEMAVTIESVEEAKGYIKGWYEGNDPSKYVFVEVRKQKWLKDGIFVDAKGLRKLGLSMYIGDMEQNNGSGRGA